MKNDRKSTPQPFRYQFKNLKLVHEGDFIFGYLKKSNNTIKVKSPVKEKKKKNNNSATNSSKKDKNRNSLMKNKKALNKTDDIINTKIDLKEIIDNNDINNNKENFAKAKSKKLNIKKNQKKINKKEINKTLENEKSEGGSKFKLFKLIMDDDTKDNKRKLEIKTVETESEEISEEKIDNYYPKYFNNNTLIAKENIYNIFTDQNYYSMNNFHTNTIETKSISREKNKKKSTSKNKNKTKYNRKN